MTSQTLIHFAVPVLDIRLVGAGRSQKRHMVGALDSIRGDARHAFTTCLRDSVMTVDQVVTLGGNLREYHRPRQIRCADGQLVQLCAVPGVGDVVQRDELSTESPRGTNVGQEPGDVELENPVGIDLVTFEGLAGPKARIEVEPHGTREG